MSRGHERLASVTTIEVSGLCGWAAPEKFRRDHKPASG